MTNFCKPSYIPDEFLSATRHGWVDKRTGEILVAVANLDTKLGVLVGVPDAIENIIEESIEEAITKIVEEDKVPVEVVAKEVVVVEVAPKRRGRPKKS